MVCAEDGVGNVAVRNKLYGAVVVAQLLLGDYIRVVTVHVAVDADDVTNHARNGAHIVRYHDDSHLVVQMV